jgi:predicted nucleic acid-binding protein
MILLDTDVLSALVRPTPDETVVDWLKLQDIGLLGTTCGIPVITPFEPQPQAPAP